ncbi:MAG: hypothetical protein Kow0029_31160 [Candidatus Rifleibacteriota bacterium]
MLGDITFLETIIYKLEQNRIHFNSFVFVGQSHDLASKNLVEKRGYIWVINETPEKGPLDSIKKAIAALTEDSAIMLWPVDHPMVASGTINLICERHYSEPEKIIVPSIDNRRGHPTIFPANLKKMFFEIPDNEGARKILQLYPERISHVTTDDIWVRKNLNTPESLNEAREWLKKNSVTLPQKSAD